MHNYKKSSTNFFGRNILKTAALTSLLVFSNAYATGLGKLTVLSSLGQPLKAEIELTSVNRDEIASLVPKISSVETFRQANIEFNPALLSLRFSVVPKGNGYVIKVTSTQPMNEPWVDFLLEMKADGGRLVREYTFLLDPAELSTNQLAQIAIPAPLISSVRPSAPVYINNSIPKESSLVVKKSESIKKTNKPIETSTLSEQSGGEYRVRSGDTLMQIASKHLQGTSLDQMLVSIYQENPDAFVGQNMNRLKAGQVLKIPDSTGANSNSHKEAQSIIRAHTIDFNVYRNKLAGKVTVASKNNDSIKDTSKNVITSKIKEQSNKVNESLDKLKLSTVERSKGIVSKNTYSKLEEDRIANDKALQEANARVKELEKNVYDLNKLLAVPSKNNVVQGVTSSKTIEKKVEPKIETHAPVVPKFENSPTKLSVAENNGRSGSSVTSQSASAKISPPRPKKPLPPAVAEENSWMDNTYVAPIIVVLLLLLAAFGLYSSRKKREAHQFEDSILTGSSLKANSMFGSTGGQSVDTNNSVFNSNFAPSASQLDANEVDPVAEADVYIAYGRDSQAEEILKEALRTQPERHAVRIKLLEIYFARKDQKSFELLAGELYGMTRGEGDDWAQAASMGLSLDPSNPLYAGANPQAETYLPGLSLPTQPLEDADVNELLEGSLSPDMLDSISIIDLASGHFDSYSKVTESLGGTSASQKLKEDSFNLDGLDFDLDISDEEDSDINLDPTIPDISISTPDSIVRTEENIPSIDFGSIDFDLGNAESELESSEFQDSNDKKDDFLNLTPESNISMPIESMEFDSDHEVEITPNEEGALNVDLSNLEFELSNNPVEGVDTSADIKLEYNAEMATKLDLAVAYQEIGDREGARELLDEVIKGGSQVQIEQAKEMLKQIS
jgi:pilus assembly protein FimV